MPDESGFGIIKRYSLRHSLYYVKRQWFWINREKALELGAKGYLSKRCSPDELIQAVRTVYAGGVYLMPELTAKLVSSTAKSLPSSGLNS